ncbi:TPA: EAL domain-containing protein [Aeromonas veronii]|nr:EAL domain-containing protein [Aeromonas veronii]
MQALENNLVSNVKPLDYSEIIEPFYQPILNRERQVIGFEALARYRVYPCEGYRSIDFQTVNNDDALHIDIIMLKAILRHLPRIAKFGARVLSINLNPTLGGCTYQNLLLVVLMHARKLDIIIWFEVLEYASLGSKEVALIEILRSHGARIVCDDFGTYECNFQRVMMLPYEIIKLDRSLLLQATKSSHALRMLAGLVKYLQQLDMKIVCEGIETKTHLDIADRLGCEYQQGYLYAMPSPLSRWISVHQSTFNPTWVS